MEKWKQWLAKWTGEGQGKAGRAQVLRWLLLLGLIGAALMILNSFIQVKEIDPAGADGEIGDRQPADLQTFAKGGNNDDSKFRDYEEAYEARLKEILKNLVGVGEADVLVTIDSTEEIMVERNRKDTQEVVNEKDANGTTRNVTNVTRSGEVVLYQVSGDQKPLVLKYIKPKIRGVVVVARGAENMAVKKMISEAVERGLDVPPHRVSVLPRKQR